MTRDDILAAAVFHRDAMLREAKRRAKRYPAISEQLTRHAQQIQRQIEELKCGPLFAERTEAAAS